MRGYYHKLKFVKGPLMQMELLNMAELGYALDKSQAALLEFVKRDMRSASTTWMSCRMALEAAMARLSPAEQRFRFTTIDPEEIMGSLSNIRVSVDDQNRIILLEGEVTLIPKRSLCLGYGKMPIEAFKVVPRITLQSNAIHMLVGFDLKLKGI